MDCLVVSFSQGLLIRFKRRKISNLLALIMGLFQGGMPLIGYLLTGFVYDYIAPFAKSLVFGIFMFLGGKFIIEACKNEEKIEHTQTGLSGIYIARGCNKYRRSGCRNFVEIDRYAAASLLRNNCARILFDVACWILGRLFLEEI